MGRVFDFYNKANDCNLQAGVLEVQKVLEARRGAIWEDELIDRIIFNEAQDELGDEATIEGARFQRDWHLQLSDTASRNAKKLRAKACHYDRVARWLERLGTGE